MPGTNDQFKQFERVEQTRTVPAAAMCLNVGRMQFIDAGESSKKVPIKLLGRTGKPIQHWYWGNVVHDMDGMTLAKETLPIDYCHFPDEVLGYLNEFDTSSGDLIATGELVPFADGDRASEVTFKARSGVPYEASIDFTGGPLRLEEIEAGITVKVNGNDVSGPAVIIRQWTLRGIAVCPYGADMNTKTELSAKGEKSGTLQVTIFKEVEVANKNEKQSVVSGQLSVANEDEATPTVGKPEQLAADQKRGEAAVKPETVKAEKLTDQNTSAEANPLPALPREYTGEGKEFVAAFGDVGARWFLEGRSFNECATEFIAGKDKKINELSGEVQRLTGLLGELPRGNESVAFKATEDKKTAPLPKGVNGGAAAVVASAMSARKQQDA